MIPVVFNYPTETAVEVCATQTTTASNASLIINGGLSNIGALNAPYPYVAAAVLPGIQRTIQISCTGDISTSTFTISGFDLRATGLLSTTLAGPSGTLIPTHTTIEFNRVTSVSVGTLASIPFTVGVGATGSSNWVQTDTFANPFSLNVTVLTGASQTVTVQNTADNPNTSTAPAVFAFVALTSVIANTQAAYTATTAPVSFVRAAFTATAVGAATSSATQAAKVTFIQAGT